MFRAVRIVLLVAVSLVAATCRSSPVRAPDITNVDIVLTIQADGTLHGRETWQTRNDSGTPAAFVRRVAPGHYDSLTAEQTPGANIDVDGATIAWRSEVTQPHTIVIAYRAGGVLEVLGAQYRVTWEAIPAEVASRVDRARIALELPPTMTLLAPSGIAEAGWTVETHARGLVATRNDLDPGASATVLALVDAPGLRLAEPHWQFVRQRAAELTPAFYAAALFLLVVAIGILLLLWWQARLHPAPPGPHPFARPLRDAGFAVIGLAVAWAVATELVMIRFGSAARAIPLSLVGCGALFVVVALAIGPGRARRTPR